MPFAFLKSMQQLHLQNKKLSRTIRRVHGQDKRLGATNGVRVYGFCRAVSGWGIIAKESESPLRVDKGQVQRPKRRMSSDYYSRRANTVPRNYPPEKGGAATALRRLLSLQDPGLGSVVFDITILAQRKKLVTLRLHAVKRDQFRELGEEKEQKKRSFRKLSNDISSDAHLKTRLRPPKELPRERSPVQRQGGCCWKNLGK
ncbi:hypothetical protein SCHPADRAFT_957310 [Schizopora paradoxa]|uniref:Uncharacterized protein n=1 Tax=Schizopora paradoxa TaxID=27342 RepID=A0A0H2S118_9AGAM|nr:hypothetical protein SCHPADRAFT_957310 [Schizopora paradoxa]